jgi:Cytochrome b subunit of the bc complex
MNWLTGLWRWVDARLPVQRAWDTHMGKYYAPKNFNFWYFFGVLSLVVLVNQLVTGIWLTMSYEPTGEGAFASVEYIMRDVEYGWILRYLHSTGASAFFFVVYLHMFRGLLYGSYRAPRELVWLFGMAIYLALMAEAFLGYVLPWGQMSYWGAQVIISLFGAIPYFGDAIVEWVRGDYLISGITLNRFFALHVVALPIVLLALVVLHLLALHEVGSNNPDGVEIKKNKDANGIPLDGIPFHPYYTVHDLVPIVVFLFVFCFIVFFMPEMGGYFIEKANFEHSNPLKTPPHIAPVWYFTPFYSMLRAVPTSSWVSWSWLRRWRSCSCCPGWIAARSNQFGTKAPSAASRWWCSPPPSSSWASLGSRRRHRRAPSWPSCARVSTSRTLC